MTVGGYLEDILNRTEEDLASLQNSKIVNSDAKLLSMLNRLEKLYLSLKEMIEVYESEPKSAISAILEKEESVKNSQHVILELKEKLSRTEADLRASNDYVNYLNQLLLPKKRKSKI